MQQLDIFADSEPVRRANALVDALVGFDRLAAYSALQNLQAVDPRCEDLPSFQLLCDFVAGWPDSRVAINWPRSPADVAALEAFLREHIVPATLILGEPGSRALLRKCWADLAAAAEACAVGPENRACFAAELYLRAEAFSEGVRCALDVPGGALRAAVQRWLSLGYHGCGEAKQSRCAALRYAWLAPQAFGNLLAELGDTALDRDWRDFQADLGDLDATWFPAWCAHEQKIDATLLENLPAIDGASAYRLVSGLALRERGGLGAAVFDERARLKRLNESFFAFYLQRRSNEHAQHARLK
jgi:hypothetical protein